MIPVLRGIIENAILRNGFRIVGAGDNIFERLAFPFGASNQIIAINYIGVVMQIMICLLYTSPSPRDS